MTEAGDGRLTREALKQFEGLFSGLGEGVQIRRTPQQRGKKTVPAYTLYMNGATGILRMENVQVLDARGMFAPVEPWEDATRRQHPLLASIEHAPDALFAMSEEIRELWADQRVEVERLQRVQALHAESPCPFCGSPGLHQVCADVLAQLRAGVDYHVHASWCSWGEEELMHAYAQLGLPMPVFGGAA